MRKRDPRPALKTWGKWAVARMAYLLVDKKIRHVKMYLGSNPTARGLKWTAVHFNIHIRNSVLNIWRRKASGSSSESVKLALRGVDRNHTAPPNLGV